MSVQRGVRRKAATFFENFFEVRRFQRLHLKMLTYTMADFIKEVVLRILRRYKCYTVEFYSRSNYFGFFIWPNYF